MTLATFRVTFWARLASEVFGLGREYAGLFRSRSGVWIPLKIKINNVNFFGKSWIGFHIQLLNISIFQKIVSFENLFEDFLKDFFHDFFRDFAKGCFKRFFEDFFKIFFQKVAFFRWPNISNNYILWEKLEQKGFLHHLRNFLKIFIKFFQRFDFLIYSKQFVLRVSRRVEVSCNRVV